MRNSLTSRALVAVAVALLATIGAALSNVSPATAAATTDGAAWPFAVLDVPRDRPTGAGVTVAVVDSGIDAGHPAFAGRIAAAVDCVGADGSPDRCRRGASDDNGHGTHIAGIVGAALAANAPEEGATEGIAPGVELLAVRSLTNTCDGRRGDRECRALGELGDVVAGVRWAISHGADVINLSIDAGVDLDWAGGDLADAVRTAWSRGIVVVASAGNRSEAIDDRALERLPLVLVGALDADGRAAAYTNMPTTAQFALMAPGGEAGGDCPASAIRSTFPRAIAAAGVGCLAGTSMAAAYVTGSLASVMSTGVDAKRALAHLLQTARPATGPSPATVDLGAALATPVPSSPAASPVASDVAGEVATVESSPAAATRLTDLIERHPMRVRAIATLLLVGAVIGWATTRRRVLFPA